jgi:hypothetical protein
MCITNTTTNKNSFSFINYNYGDDEGIEEFTPPSGEITIYSLIG